MFNKQGSSSSPSARPTRATRRSSAWTADGFKIVYTCTVFETCGRYRFHKDNKRVYLETNKGDATISAG